MYEFMWIKFEMEIVHHAPS